MPSRSTLVIAEWLRLPGRGGLHAGMGQLVIARSTLPIEQVSRRPIRASGLATAFSDTTHQ